MRQLESEHEAAHPPEESTDAADEASGEETEVEPVCQVVDLHEIKTLNELLLKLKDYGFTYSDFVSAGIQNAEQVYPFAIDRDDQSVKLESLRAVWPALRNLGEKGLTLTRFKGLGEMDAKDLKDTTMNPATRTLIRVAIDEDEPGETAGLVERLMGKKPELRFEYIQDNARFAEDLDV